MVLAEAKCSAPKTAIGMAKSNGPKNAILSGPRADETSPRSAHTPASVIAAPAKYGQNTSLCIKGSRSSTSRRLLVMPASRLQPRTLPPNYIHLPQSHPESGLSQ
jgi:hypothetical protein